MRNFLLILFVAVLLGAAGFAAVPAKADPLDDARAAGQIGERPDGYVAVVNPAAPADIKALVDSINRQRRDAYQQIAQQKGVPIEQIGALTAEKIFSENLRPGMYYMDATGAWKQK
ncbi:MAG: YdbL family protein [Rhodospirillaceae bacterium]|nr:YdbL family protein [Rhodospirillaceae bacterium]